MFWIRNSIIESKSSQTFFSQKTLIKKMCTFAKKEKNQKNSQIKNEYT
jgi:hypothetical protein